MKRSSQFLFAFATILCFAFTVQTRDVKPFVVVIDAGHGGNDFGAKHDTHLEKEITEQIAQRIKALHKNENVILKFTRTGDQDVSLQQRTALINQLRADLVLSLHVSVTENASASGAELFVSDQNQNAEKSMVLAKKLRLALESNTKLKVRDLKTAPFYILKNSDAPAITVELGFLSNKKDLKYLTEESSQQQIAQTIVDYINNI